MAESGTGVRGAQTRQRLLEVAVRRFAEQGYRATSLSAVAREAGVTPAAVYPYFRDKEGLFLAAFDADASGLLDSALPDDPSVLFAWIGLLPRITDGLDRHPLARRILEGREPDTTPRLLELSSVGRLKHDLEQAIRAAQRIGLARRDIDPGLVATGLQTVLLSILLAAIQTGVIDDPIRRDGILALVVAALRDPAAGPPARDREVGRDRATDERGGP